MNNENTTQREIIIQVQPTPNPNAWKFILDTPVLNDGKATYANLEEAQHNLLASSLFQVEGVRQVHFFQNVITITHSFDAEIDALQPSICAVIQTRMPMHNPNQTVRDERTKARLALSQEQQKIEEILDRTVRPGLQGDGGDITIVKYEDNKLQVYYEGACGTCPSSTTGTLMAIESILRNEFNPQIEVIPV